MRQTAAFVTMVLAVVAAVVVIRGLSHGIPSFRHLLSQAVFGCLLSWVILILLVFLLWLARTLIASSQ